jgi:NAD-dependent histone deacetylase SIR2
LFKTLRKSQNLRSSGKDLFDASVYQDDQSTSSFHEMVRGLSTVTKTAQPTAFHHLLATLAEEGRLLRLYTQNVDGIDTSLKPLATEIPLPKKGPWPKTIQLHGGLEKMVCSKCHQLSDLEPGLFDGPIPPSCAKCEHTDSLRAISNMRSHGIGRLRPRMVLYNEHNPDDEAIGSVTHMDLKTRPDAVIVAGTTLKVPGVRRITREMCAVVRGRRDGMTVWINNDPEPIGKDLENCWDLIVRGPCDEVARHAAMRKWYEPKEEAKEVTDEQVAKAKANAPQVVIPSPKKSVIDIRQEQLVTPVASPRMAPQPSIETLQSSQDLPTPTKKRKITPTSKLAEMFDASTGSKPALKPAPKKRGPKLKNSIPGTTTKAVPKNPKTTAKATKPTKKATKSTKKVTTGKITNNFTVSKTAPKQTLKIKLSPQAETINVSPKKLVGTAIEMPTKTIPMAPLSPQAARNNASPPHNPPTPLQSPAVKHVNPVNPISTPKRITPTQARKGDTISPTGTLPHGLANFID